MTNYKVHYFDGKGVAEGIRMLFGYVNVKFEDILFKMEEFTPELKESKKSLKKLIFRIIFWIKNSQRFRSEKLPFLKLMELDMDTALRS